MIYFKDEDGIEFAFPYDQIAHMKFEPTGGDNEDGLFTVTLKDETEYFAQGKAAFQASAEVKTQIKKLFERPAMPFGTITGPYPPVS